jgi:hypothetical protein
MIYKWSSRRDLFIVLGLREWSTIMSRGEELKWGGGTSFHCREDLHVHVYGVGSPN